MTSGPLDSSNRNIDLAFTFDTTGSMSPCIFEVRRRITETTKRLFKDLPGLRVAILAHGDYCDRDKAYVTQWIDFTADSPTVVDFVKKVGRTDGGDEAECYELVLHEANQFSWRDDAEKVLVMVGDEVPHRAEEDQNFLHLDWTNEAQNLAGRGILIYGVQCLRKHWADFFWKGIAQIGNGVRVELHQFSNIVELIHAVAYKQAGGEALQGYANELESKGEITRAIAGFLDILSGNKVTYTIDHGAIDLEAVPLGRFQILHADSRIGIKHFVEETGADFKIGHGFYEHVKKELVQETKEVVLVHKRSGDMFTGHKARDMIGCPYGERLKITPAFLPDYDVFIQSTSWNRILPPSTRLLYEPV